MLSWQQDFEAALFMVQDANERLRQIAERFPARTGNLKELLSILSGGFKDGFKEKLQSRHMGVLSALELLHSDLLQEIDALVRKGQGEGLLICSSDFVTQGSLQLTPSPIADPSKPVFLVFANVRMLPPDHWLQALESKELYSGSSLVLGSAMRNRFSQTVPRPWYELTEALRLTAEHEQIRRAKAESAQAVQQIRLANQELARQETVAAKRWG